MSSKFELSHPLQPPLPSPKPTPHKKSTLLEYKQVIIELSDALNTTTAENQKLKQEIGILKQREVERERDRERRDGVGEVRCEELGRRNRELEEELGMVGKELEKYGQQLQKCYAKIKSLQSTNHTLQQSLTESTKTQTQQSHLLHLSTQKIKILQQALESAINHNQQIKYQISEAHRLNEEHVRDLKDFQECVRRKFQVLDVVGGRDGYGRDGGDFGEFGVRIEGILGRDKRSCSTQKKLKRNVGHLSSTKNPQKITTRTYPTHTHSHHAHNSPHIIKPFQPSPINPQLTSQLQNLKKQIAQQYTLINLKDETYSKQRVGKTLEKLKRIMGKAYQKVQQSQSQLE